MDDKRISRVEYFINSALLVSLRSGCQRMSVGAVVVKENRIIVTGYNGPPVGFKCESTQCNVNEACTHAIHAEANAIYFASKKGISLEGSIIYCTDSPCKKCAEAILQAGILRVYYLKEYRNTEGIELLRGKNIDCIDLGKDESIKILIPNETQV